MTIHLTLKNLKKLQISNLYATEYQRNGSKVMEIGTIIDGANGLDTC